MRKAGRTKKETVHSPDTETKSLLLPSGVTIKAKNGGFYVYLGVSLMAITTTQEAAEDAARELI